MDITLDQSNWLVVAALAAPHLLYAYIWFFPQQWMQAFKRSSVDVFASIAAALKVVQFSSVIYWYMLRKPSGLDFAAITPMGWLFAAVLGLAGQTLNTAIYKAIGKEGVYYGFKLGHKIPWVTGFPFNTVSHPQYVGSVMSVWGAVALVYSQAPTGITLIGLYWTLLYIITGIQEDKLHL